MQCDDFLPMIEKLADGECSAVEKQRVETHLEACDACREHYEFLKALPAAARKTTLPEPPGAYWEVLPRKIMSRIEREQSSQKSSGWFPAWLAPSQLRWLAVVAAGLVALVLSYEVMMVGPAMSPAPEQPASDAFVAEDKDVPAAFEPVSKEPAVKRLEQEGQEAREVQRQDADDLVPASSAKQKARRVTPSSPEKTSGKSDEQVLRRDRPFESPASVLEEGEAEGGLAAFADEEAVVLKEEVGKKAATPPTEPPEVVADAPKSPQAVSRDESKPSVEAEPSPGRGRAKLEANQARALDRMAVAATRSQKTNYRGTLGGAGELSEVETEAQCNHLRDSLERGLEGEELLNARFEVAECSMDLAKLSPTEERLRRAREDVTAFLAISPEGEKAEKLKRQLDALEKK